MFAGPHWLAGAAIASVIVPRKPSPPKSKLGKGIQATGYMVAAFTFAFFSHFVLDALPHREYRPIDFWTVLFVNLDLIVFFSIIFMGWRLNTTKLLRICITLGLIAASIPDVIWMSFVYAGFDYSGFKEFSEIHHYFHTNNHYGIGYQYITAVVCALILYFRTNGPKS
ncbi:hypothetical protein KW791_03910 [Candidatus Parcubacteria bacterium]|nr:hypothetical protein [Candidatus Parcubacteria bacterium]